MKSIPVEIAVCAVTHAELYDLCHFLTTDAQPKPGAEDKFNEWLERVNQWKKQRPFKLQGFAHEWECTTDKRDPE